METKILISLIKSVQCTLLSMINFFVCVMRVDDSTLNHTEKRDDVALNYSQFYMQLGCCIKTQIQRWTTQKKSTWKRESNSRAELIKIQLFAINRCHLSFSKLVSAVTLVGFYRHAPADAICIVGPSVQQCRHVSLIRTLNINHKSSNHIHVVAAFFYFN